MKETIYQIGRARVKVVNPESPDQHERLEKALVQFAKAVEKEKAQRKAPNTKENNVILP